MATAGRKGSIFFRSFQMSSEMPFLPSLAAAGAPPQAQPRPLAPLIILLLAVFAFALILHGRSGPVQPQAWTDVITHPGIVQPHIRSPLANTLHSVTSDPLHTDQHITAPVVQENMRDADVYLKRVGIPPKLPELHVQYGKVHIHPGAQFQRTDTFLQNAPDITWDRDLGPCTVLVLDPDAPTPASDRSLPGPRGPWLHLLVTDAVGKASKGLEEVSYAAPTPPQGNHRYIFVLLQQPTLVKHIRNDRSQWDVEQFLRANPTLTPVAANFFYTAAA
eukprot:GGOE01054044.1.p1 GENE.GGOE01054044.1~~GGOE01054044.1.p1  ORF type:complete len:276 (+),score=40.52 GGOE01054044.1:1-828(+)